MLTTVTTTMTTTVVTVTTTVVIESLLTTKMTVVMVTLVHGALHWHPQWAANGPPRLYHGARDLGPTVTFFALQLNVRASEVRAYPEEPAAKRRRLWDAANMQVGNLLMRFSQQEMAEAVRPTQQAYIIITAMVKDLCRYVVQLEMGESKPHPFEDFRDQVSEISFFRLGDLVGHWRTGRTGHVENKDYKTKKIQIQFLDGALEWRWPAAFVYVDWRPVPQGQQD